MLEFSLIAVFSLALLALLYTYVFYPFLVYLVSMLTPNKDKLGEFEPNVTILITAYNEEAAIADKIRNTLEIDYPKEKLQILVASDGSSDKTDEIVESFKDEGVELFHQPGRKGKTFTQNEAVKRCTGEIILFSDATTDYRSDVLRALVPYFNDPEIGCAAGKLTYVDDKNSDVGSGAQKYWSYETFIKISESKACSLIGASGCLYAVRKSAYLPMYPEACSDFLICTILYEQGFRSVFVPEAICFENTNDSSSKEFRMRVRVISQTFTDLWRNARMMNPLKSGFYAVQLFSHKLMRYSVPVFLFLLFLTSGLLAISYTAFLVLFLGQLFMYGLAFLGYVLEKQNIKIGPLAIPLYFVLANLASVAGFLKFLKGENFAAWEPIRENGNAAQNT